LLRVTDPRSVRIRKTPAKAPISRLTLGGSGRIVGNLNVFRTVNESRPAYAGHFQDDRVPPRIVAALP